jgi:hypothetical protein
MIRIDSSQTIKKNEVEEEKDTLIAGYWLKFITLFNNIEKADLENTKDVKKYC